MRPPVPIAATPPPERASGPLKLHTGTPFWISGDRRPPHFPPLEASVACDVAVIGGGIAGALVADAVSRDGGSVVVLDRRETGAGSTAASTALLQYELDVPLHELSGLIGPADAERAFRVGIEAIDALEERCLELGAPFERVPSLHFTCDEASLGGLRAEYAARRRAGLAVRWLSPGALRSEWGIHARGAILSEVAAQTDPLALCSALLRRAAERGARVHARTPVTAILHRGEHRVLCTRNGATVRADLVVHAGGYEAARLLPPGLVELHSTYALATRPVPREAPRPRRCTLWEYASPYLYARWAGDRLLVGGGDEPFAAESAQNAAIPHKTRALLEQFGRLVPHLKLEAAHAWAGPFASTPDGIGYIGPLPDDASVLLALGFGGNGITFAAVAARLIADRASGRPNPDARLFAFERDTVARPEAACSVTGGEP